MKNKVISRIIALSITLLFVAAYAESAFAASFAVKIRQINPDGEAQQVTCAINTKCSLPIVTKAGQALTVVMVVGPDSVGVKFQTPKGYLYAAERGNADGTYSTIWMQALEHGKPSTGYVTLVLPEVPGEFTAPILSVAREAALKNAHQTVADLEITTQPAP